MWDMLIRIGRSLSAHSEVKLTYPTWVVLPPTTPCVYIEPLFLYDNTN